MKYFQMEGEMEKSLIEELKQLLSLIENYKEEAKELSIQKEGFNTVKKHLNLAIEESKSAVELLIENINTSLELINSSLNEIKNIKENNDNLNLEKIESNLEKVVSVLTDSLTSLEFQDILAQRLQKTLMFLSDVEKTILKILLMLGINEEEFKDKQEELKKKLEELEWKKELSQNDVDNILKEFGL